MYDLLIQNVNLYDGTGQPPCTADVAIEGERIAAIELSDGQGIPPQSARQILSGQSLCLAPGFVDIHSHSDLALLVCTTADSKIHQGITTDVFGNCGESAFPISPKNRQDYQQSLKSIGAELAWESISDYRKLLENTPISVHAMTLVGHASVRSAVMGYEDRPPTSDELKAMEHEVEKAVEEGAVGLSTGLQYPPGRFAAREEVMALANAARRKGGIYTTHMRCEGDDLMESIEETLDVTRQTGIPTIISHLKASGRPNWGKVAHAITQIEIARRQGFPVVFDRYPYLASSTTLDIYMPAWAQSGGKEQLTERLKSGDEKLFAEYRSLVETQSGWENILIVDTPAQDANSLIGKSVAQIASERGKEGWRTAIDLLIEGNCRVDMCNFSMCQEDTDRVLAHPYCMIGTDASIASNQGALGRRKPHPRAYGTFPRFLSEYVRDRHLLSVEEAIRRMSALPAEVLGLKQRGLVKKGYYADLVVFQLERLEDHARFGDPHHFPGGIVHVLVNGQPVILDGKHTGARPGQFLCR